MKSLRRLLQLSWSDRRVLAEAVVRVVTARCAVAALPFRRIAPALGRPRMVSRASPGPDQRPVVQKIAWAFAVTERRLPRWSTCLAQAIAANAMLKRRGIPRTVYLGMKKKTDGLWAAHAWLRSGAEILTGGPEMEGYTVVMTFADERELVRADSSGSERDTAESSP